MANTIVSYQEVRFVIEAELTHCYILVKNESNDGFPVGGWHHKAFPASKSAQDIFADLVNGKEQPLLWARQAPPANTGEPLQPIGMPNSVVQKSTSEPCPHAGPFMYCPTCPVTPCPIGLGVRNER